MRSQCGPLAFEDFDCPFPLQFAVAGVAVCPTLLATTAQPAQQQGGRRGWALELAAARVCREGGARVRLNVFVRDMDLTGPNRLDGRRLEVVADGLHCMEGPSSQSTQQWCRLSTGTALLGEGLLTRTGMARRRKERTYPELAGEGGRARLVVLGAEVGRRWSTETAQFLWALAWAKVRELPEELQGDARRAWSRRWNMVLGCAAARAVAMSLLVPGGYDGAAPSVHDVVRDERYARA